MEIAALIVVWLGFGALGTAYGNAELRKRFPAAHTPIADAAAYSLALLGPFNLLGAFICFGILNRRKASDAG